MKRLKAGEYKSAYEAMIHELLHVFAETGQLLGIPQFTITTSGHEGKDFDERIDRVLEELMNWVSTQSPATRDRFEDP